MGLADWIFLEKLAPYDVWSFPVGRDLEGTLCVPMAVWGLGSVRTAVYKNGASKGACLNT